MFRLTWSLLSVHCSLLPEQGKSVEVYLISAHSLLDLLCATSSNKDECDIIYLCKPGASMSAPPPSRGQKALLGIHKTISCICNSSIQDATHRVVHTLDLRSRHLPPSPHHLEFTEKPMQCNMYKKVTIHV